MQECQTSIKLMDSTESLASAGFIIGAKNNKIDSRELPKVTILANQFLEQNRSTLNLFGVSANVINDGYSVKLHFIAHDQIGACPLKSPTSGRYEYGLIIEPRFKWKGLGCMLDAMGWKIIPELQKLPMLPNSSREVPTWVLCSVIIMRIEGLLKNVTRKFEENREYLSSPRGRIDWDDYSKKQISQMKFLNIPCEFSSLNEHIELLGAVRYTLQRILSELVAVKSGGTIVFQLILRAQRLLQRLSAYLPIKPTPQMLSTWISAVSMKNTWFCNGLEAMQWAVENRGLAGLSDFRGLPWKMSMSAFFEAWVETISHRLVSKIGGIVLSGRTNETVVPIAWETASQGTQKSLRPDIVIQKENSVIIIDAKFKSHWTELNAASWMAMDLEHQEDHRHDLLQVLAYSTCFSRKELKVCLVYPCKYDVWTDLVKRGRSYRKASIYSGTRHVEVILTAVPMSGNIEEIASEQARWIA